MSNNNNTLLVVGNGFDLAHGMKTSYRNILDAIMADLAAWMQNIDFTPQQQKKALSSTFDEEMINKVFVACGSNWEKTHLHKINSFSSTKLQDKLTNSYHYARDFLFNYGNWWFQHFMHVLMNRERRIGDGWVDLEAEIRRVVTNVENLLLGKTCETDIENELGGYAQDLIALREQFIPELKNDIAILNTIIEFYLSLEEIHNENRKLQFFDSLKNVKAVLSYNYTHTYQNLYNKSLRNVCYLHGEINQHNLVLGTNETLPDEIKDKVVECANFKKIYQLIYYRLGNSFKQIFTKAGDTRANWNAVIYGHSLTPADKYSLGWLFEKSNTNLFAGVIKNIIIYYYDENAYNEQLSNLFQIIGQERVLAYITNGNIEFREIPKE